MDTEIPRPIVILAASRSGSSLVAGVFHGHGCWVGRTQAPNIYNPKGFFENLDVKERIQDAYWIDKRGDSEEFRDWIINHMKNDDSYQGGPWVVKHGAPAWWVWEDIEPQYVNVRREKNSSMASRRRMGLSMDGKLWDRHLEAFEETKKRGAVEIWPDKFTKGDFSELEHAINSCGLTYDQKIVDNFYDRELWHY